MGVNRTDTLKALAFKKGDEGEVVSLPKNIDDYVIGIAKNDTPKNYYTYIFTEYDSQAVMKTSEDLKQGDPVTLMGIIYRDSLDYMWGTLIGYAVDPKALRYMSKDEKEEYRFKPKGE